MLVFQQRQLLIDRSRVLHAMDDMTRELFFFFAFFFFSSFCCRGDKKCRRGGGGGGGVKDPTVASPLNAPSLFEKNQYAQLSTISCLGRVYELFPEIGLLAQAHAHTLTSRYHHLRDLR